MDLILIFWISSSTFYGSLNLTKYFYKRKFVYTKFKTKTWLPFYLDLGLDILDGVTGLHLQGDGLTRQGLHEYLHLRCLKQQKK